MPYSVVLPCTLSEESYSHLQVIFFVWQVEYAAVQIRPMFCPSYNLLCTLSVNLLWTICQSYLVVLVLRNFHYCSLLSTFIKIENLPSFWGFRIVFKIYWATFIEIYHRSSSLWSCVVFWKLFHLYVRDEYFNWQNKFKLVAYHWLMTAVHIGDAEHNRENIIEQFKKKILTIN